MSFLLNSKSSIPKSFDIDLKSSLVSLGKSESTLYEKETDLLLIFTECITPISAAGLP